MPLKSNSFHHFTMNYAIFSFIDPIFTYFRIQTPLF